MWINGVGCWNSGLTQYNIQQSGVVIILPNKIACYIHIYLLMTIMCGILKHFLPHVQALYTVVLVFHINCMGGGGLVYVFFFFFTHTVVPLLMFSSFPLVPASINKWDRICLSLSPRLFAGDPPSWGRLMIPGIHLSLSLTTLLSFPFPWSPNATVRLGKETDVGPL
jgi:hypothetical protein